MRAARSVGWLPASAVFFLVLLHLACLVVSTQDVSSLAKGTSLLDSWTPPLSTRGRYIVDANGRRFKLKGGNWHGASGTYTGFGDYDDPSNHHAGEVAYQTVLGLDRKPLDELVDDMIALGINTVRLPFSNEMLHTTSQVPDKALAANPQLHNKTPLEVYDVVVSALTRRGVAVILNNHTVRSRWCCGLDSNARWNGAQTTQEWIEDWVRLARRYSDNPRVVGAALYNEVRRDVIHDPSWGGGGEYDWYSASMAAATRIQREANADMLIIVEGINWVGVPAPLLPHWRPELQPVASLSHALPIPDKLVYSAHFYGYTGPNATGSIADSSLREVTYAELSSAQLRETVRDLAAYVATTASQHFTAPVWISEFGAGGRNEYSARARRWWRAFVDLLSEEDMDFAVWPLVGWHEFGQGDLWALNAYDAKGHRLGLLEAGDWRTPDWIRLIKGQKQTAQSTLRRTPTYRMLAPDWTPQQQSNWLHRNNIAQPGRKRASCPDGLRLMGFSADSRALCSDAVYGRYLWDYEDDGANVTVVRALPSSASTGRTSIAGRLTFSCPPNSLAIGYSTATVVCAPLVWRKASGQRRSVALAGQGAERALRHGRFADVGVPLGACEEDEIVAGYVRGQGGDISALLCERLAGRA